MDPIKEAFAKIKQDIYSLQSELLGLRQEVQTLTQKQTSTNQHSSPLITLQQTNTQTHSTPIPTQNTSLEPLKAPNYPFSIGNGGVPTDKQTNIQTVRHTQNTPISPSEGYSLQDPNPNTFDEAEEAITSLNALKNQIKHKFKSLTPQEMIVFSTIYEFQDQNLQVTYKTLATHLKLSESSIRDYINRLVRKEVPILKEKVNNKLILLSISQNLCKNLSLSSIIALRDL
jgi:hypothetical protein